MIYLKEANIQKYSENIKKYHIQEISRIVTQNVPRKNQENLTQKYQKNFKKYQENLTLNISRKYHTLF